MNFQNCSLSMYVNSPCNLYLHEEITTPILSNPCNFKCNAVDTNARYILKVMFLCLIRF